MRIAATFVGGQAMILDLSKGGAACFIATEDVVADVEGLRFKLGENTIELKTRVIWNLPGVVDRYGNDGVVLGLQFLESSSELEKWLQSWKPLLLALDHDLQNLQWLREIFIKDFDVLTTDDPQFAIETLYEREVAVFLLEQKMPQHSGAELLDDLRTRVPGLATTRIVLSAYTDPELLQSFLNERDVFYFAHKPTESSELKKIVGSALEHYRLTAREQLRQEEKSAGQAQQLREILDISSKLTILNDPQEAQRILSDALTTITGAEAGRFLWFDRVSRTLLDISPLSREEREYPSNVGILGYVIHTKEPFVTSKASRESKYVKEIDNPEGRDGDTLAYVPVKDGHGEVLGILHARRDSAFSTTALNALDMLAVQAAASLSHLSLQAQVEELFASRVRENTGTREAIYSARALSSYTDRGEIRGDVLKLYPEWMQWSFWASALSGLLAIIFVVFVRVPHYAEGPAVLRSRGRAAVTVKRPGLVSALLVKPGQSVARGEILFRLDSNEEQAEFDRVNHEFELLLLRRLLDPGDALAGQRLAALRAEWVQAEARVDDLSVRARQSGVVTDIRIREGLLLAPGQTALTMAPQNAPAVVTVMLPGYARPKLEVGMELIWRPKGYPHISERLLLRTIGSEVVGPQEAARYLGEDWNVTVSGYEPVVVVETEPLNRDFYVDAQRFEYFDGMTGIGETILDRDRIIFSLFPALKKAM